MKRESLGVIGACVSIARSYSLTIFPIARREVAAWRARAEEIPDPVLRGLASQALRKQGNMLGAALFAVLAPRNRRTQVVRGLIAFQAAYNYLDTLAEQTTSDPVGNGRRLHNALLVAVEPAAALHYDYYAGYPSRDDDGLLNAMVETCNGAVRRLPSYVSVADPVSTAAARIVDFQSLGALQSNDDGLARWARSSTPPGSDLRWWETAAAGGSSLAVLALIALAARPALDRRDLATIEQAYFPWIGSLHSLLDSMIDVTEDERDGQRSLIGYYASSEEAVARIRLLTKRATDATDTLLASRQHRAILIAMTGYYLSAPGASLPRVRLLAAGVADATGALSRPTRILSRVAGHVSHRHASVRG